jgi:hypothetical protein
MEANSEELSKIPEADWLFGNRKNQGVLISDSNPVSNFCRRASRLYPRVRTTINDEHRARLRSKVDTRSFGNKAVGRRDAGILTSDVKDAIRL